MQKSSLNFIHAMMRRYQIRVGLYVHAYNRAYTYQNIVQLIPSDATLWDRGSKGTAN